MKKLKCFIKILTAGLTAVIILSVFCSCYYLLPVHIDNPNHNTDYIWPANSVWIKMTEGISWGKMDAEGYNNYTVTDNPDILVLGSSHMEATNVMQSQNTCNILQKLFKGKYTVYNKAISGHTFASICQYLPDNLDLYKNPPKYVIIEASNLRIDSNDVENILNHSIPVQESHSSGIIGLLQKIPFVRLLYKQYTNGILNLFIPERISDKATDKAEDIQIVDQNAYKKLFSSLESLSSKYVTQIIILHHPTAELQKDGTAKFEEPECLGVFREECDRHNIIFVDMAESFAQMYITEHKLPHGFITGRIAYGHLNKSGHKVIAEKLYNVITEFEEADHICR